MSAALWILRAVATVLVVALFAQLSLWCAPDLEARFFPVIERQAIEDVVRDDARREVCFTWSFDKVREARAHDAGWTLRAAPGIYPFQAVRHAGDSLGPRPPGSLIERPVAPGQWTRKCLELPAALVGRAFQLTGYAEYATPLTGGLWTVRQPTASRWVP